ncbi:MAG: rhodanese-like domain-containing protein, partial [Sulfurovum sp.]
MKLFVSLIATTLSLFAIEPLVTPQWLDAHKNDSTLRIVEVSEADLYAKEHIPHAMNTQIGQWRFDNGT